jgi:hypothetical protein
MVQVVEHLSNKHQALRKEEEKGKKERRKQADRMGEKEGKL